MAVDGREVSGCSHEDVVDKIKLSGSKCCFLVVDKDTDQMYKLVSQSANTCLLSEPCSQSRAYRVVSFTGQSFSYAVLGWHKGFQLTSQLHRSCKLTCSRPTIHTCSREERGAQA